MSDVIPLYHSAWPNLQTLGELVDNADAVPPDEILERFQHHAKEAERLQDAGVAGSQLLRQMVFLGVLASRYVYEVANLPKDRTHVLAEPAVKAAAGFTTTSAVAAIGGAMLLNYFYPAALTAIMLVGVA